MIRKAGETVGRFTVLGSVVRGSRTYCACRCECGTVKEVRGDSLGKDIVSCGCRKREHLISLKFKHGKCATPTYSVWEAMIARCHNRNQKHFARYGGRGIFVCKSWRESFAAFLKDMGERPLGLTIERIDNNLGYDPSNCRWATRKEQQNNRSGNIILVVDSERMTAMQASERFGVPHGTICGRLRRGLSDRAAVGL